MRRGRVNAAAHARPFHPGSALRSFGRGDQIRGPGGASHPARFLFFLAAALALRTSADLAAAFLARAVRSSGVIVSSERFPPFFPKLLR